MIKRPDYIRKGSTIGVTAPSFGCATEPYFSRYDIAVKKIEEYGYNIVEGKTVHMSDGLGISTDPRVAASELIEFYKRDDIDAIISAGGGELMNETIGNVDFLSLKDCKPKWFMGYSDNTNFIFPLVTVTGVQGIYGPCIGGFAKEWEYTEKDSFALLEGSKSSFTGYEGFVEPVYSENGESEDIEYTYEILTRPFEINAVKVLKNFVPSKDGLGEAALGQELKMEGVLVGGCLDILVNMTGTRYDRMKDFNKENEKVVWILEACDLNPMSIRRSLWNLKEAGWFDSAEGFVFGRPRASYGVDMMGVNQYNAVTDVLKELGKPVIMDADIGHIEPMMPVVMGAYAEVFAKDNLLRVNYN